MRLSPTHSGVLLLFIGSAFALGCETDEPAGEAQQEQGSPSDSKSVGSENPFAVPADLGDRSVHSPGEKSFVGVTVEIDGQLAGGTQGLVFHSDDRRAYVGVVAPGGKLHRISLLPPAAPKYRLVMPSGLTQKTVAAEFVAWKNYGSLLVLAAPKSELPEPYPIDAEPKYVDDTRIRFNALRMTKSNDDLTFTRTLHPGVLKIIEDETYAQPTRHFATVEIPAIVGTEMPMGIVSALDGTLLGRTYESVSTADGSTVYACKPNNALIKLRAPEIDRQIEAKVGHDGTKVAVNCSLSTFDPFQRIKSITVKCRLEPFESKSVPADFKLEFVFEMRAGRRFKRQPQHYSESLPEVEMTEWTGRLEFENFRRFRYSGDETGQVRTSWFYQDVNGRTYSLDGSPVILF